MIWLSKLKMLNITKTILGSNYDDYQDALVNESKVLAAVFIELKINPLIQTHFQPHLIVLMKHLKK